MFSLNVSRLETDFVGFGLSLAFFLVALTQEMSASQFDHIVDAEMSRVFSYWNETRCHISCAEAHDFEKKAVIVSVFLSFLSIIHSSSRL